LYLTNFNSLLISVSTRQRMSVSELQLTNGMPRSINMLANANAQTIDTIQLMNKHNSHQTI